MDNEPDQEEVDSHYDEAVSIACLIVATLFTAWIVFAPFTIGG